MTLAKRGRGKGQWLKAEVKAGKLVVSIGVDVLAFAAQMHLDGEAVELSEGRERESEMVIFDAEEFARDVCRELLRESEDGAHILGDGLDEASTKAANGGSLGLCERSELPSQDCSK